MKRPFRAGIAANLGVAIRILNRRSGGVGRVFLGSKLREIEHMRNRLIWTLYAARALLLASGPARAQ